MVAYLKVSPNMLPHKITEMGAKILVFCSSWSSFEYWARSGVFT